eukprot:CAMPEP_0113711968 /NCGR_PEP_ID=MMETSP0038_2-20120614/31092_1 /TAXON_ID=2898 /ORGANISM="Cryptomonas paramecium" /LENGTH=30 /DNA_ID=CAMNT_0000638365 /DNA_START=222 /DNA_END=311 /DNA_ORIENTATION=+ /assembly_acc=CAM_ASM_000170
MSAHRHTPAGIIGFFDAGQAIHPASLEPSP